MIDAASPSSACRPHARPGWLTGLVLFCLLAPLAMRLPAQEAENWRAVATASVVRIICTGSGSFTFDPGDGETYKHVQVQVGFSGSGFFVDPGGVVVTNAHVVEAAWKGREEFLRHLEEEYLRRMLAENGLDPSRASPTARKAILERTIFNDDLKTDNLVLFGKNRRATFRIVRYGAPVGEGEDIALLRIDVRDLPVLALADSGTLEPKDPVTVMGFPSPSGNEFSLPDANGAPVVGEGMISQPKVMKDGTPVFQFTAEVREGNSGGPVLNARGEVVGIVTFRGDAEASSGGDGSAFMIASSAIQDFVRNAGVANVPGPTTLALRESVAMMRDEHYTAALKKLDEVEALCAGLAETAKMREDCQIMASLGKDKPLSEQERRAYAERAAENFSPQPKSGLWSWDRLGGGLVVLGIIVLVTAGEIWRRRRREKPSPAAPDDEPVPPPLPESRAERFPGRDVRPGTEFELLSVAGPTGRRRYPVPPEGVLIGRDRDACQVVVDAPDISPRHVRLACRDGVWYALDFGSDQGTFLNSLDHPIVGEEALNPGDMLILSWTDAARLVFLQREPEET